MQGATPTFRAPRFAVPLHPMLRKLMWTGLYGTLAAGATIAARKAASKIWRVATGEEPPAKK